MYSEFLQGIKKEIDNVRALDMSGFNPKETAVIVIDMNNGFTKSGAMFSQRAQNLVEPISGFLKKCREIDIGCIAYTDMHEEDSKEFAIYKSHCVSGTDEVDIAPSIYEYVNRIIYKNSTNGIFASNIIDGEIYKNIILCGVCTDICIMDFARSAISYAHEYTIDLNLIVVSNLVDTYDSNEHPADFWNIVSLKSMMDHGANILKAE